MVLDLSEETDGKKEGPNNYVEAVEAGSDKECGAIDSVGDSKGGFIILQGLKKSKVETK